MSSLANRTRFFVVSVFILGVFGLIQPSRLLSQDSDQSAEWLDEVVVETERMTEFDSERMNPRESGSASPDASELVEDVAGADVTSNGPISGQVQYRGFTGPRMNVSVNGHSLTPGGPNWMDPPLHYVPRALMEDLEMKRGVTSVSDGIMTLGGSARATLKSSEFTDTERFQHSGRLFGVGRTVDEGFTGGGMVSYANENRRYHVMGSTDQGDDRDFPDGTVKATEYDREVSGFGFGFREFGDTYSVDFRHTDTNNSGNPSLPMDIDFFNSDQAEAKYSTNLGGGPLTLQVNYNDIDHKMNNFELRPAPDFGSMHPTKAFDDEDRRFIVAASDDIGLHLNQGISYREGQLAWGLDYAEHDHEATVFDPDSSFFVESFDGIERDEVSGFAEWSGPYSETWDLEAGLRLTRVDMQAGQAQSDPVTTPGALENLRQEFNDSDRDEDDLNVDLSATFSRSLKRNLDMEIGLARKTRSPSYIERFGWVPIEATAGLADGNIHVGNQDLDPEVSRNVEIGLDWSIENAHITPRFFYRDVDDYIQGTAFDATPNTVDSDEERVARVNGDATPLKYRNVEAEIYGLDATWGYDLIIYKRVNLHGTVSWLKGERDDINDDLYRFAPPEASVNVNYQPENWLLAVQGEFVREQDDVSSTNDEPKTAGYGIMNMKARWFKSQRMTLTLSLNNVFDKTYRRHLSGFNRVQGSDVSTGRRSEARLPGNERNLVANVTYQW